jgi:class 3 adenylate cyclase/tetratricopeptide (TPR) repeat protein
VICAGCGEQNPDSAKFCSACGSLLGGAEREVRKTVTVLFSDLVGSTALAERLDPEAMRRVMTRYHGEMKIVLEQHGGTLEKFIGDAIVAVFGVPVTHEDDALRALRAAAEMRARLAELNDELEREWDIRLTVRTGVNTGEVVAGDPSRGQSFVSGDAVNVAARLEQAAGPDEIWIGEATRALAGNAITVDAVPPLALKGKSAPVTASKLRHVRLQAGLDRRIDTPFVGRGEEQALLASALNQSIDSNSCVLATIVGPAGIGKSRLAREFVGDAAQLTRTVVGRCLPYGEGITYWPLAEIVNGIAGDESREAIMRLIGDNDDGSLVADRIAAAVGAAEGGGQPEEIFWAFRKLFEQLARAQPLIVVIDDIHWGEPTLLDLLEYVMAFANDAPILMLCLARPELFEARPSWATPKQNAVTVQLSPISGSEASVLIEQLAVAHDVSQPARARIAEAAEGNPLFIEQLLALNVELGPQNVEVLVPPTIQALLAARIDRLESAERAVIERAAVEGRTFHRGAVAELLDEHQRAGIAAQLISLVRKEFIRPDRSLFPGDDAFRFGHILIRDAAYEGVPKLLRAELHERYAHWLERVSGTRAADYEEILAYHLEQAYRNRAELGPIDTVGAELAIDAGERLAAAGRRAFARSDVSAAINLLTRAAELLPEDHAQRLEMLPELAGALIESGELARAEAVAADGATRADAQGLELVGWRARLVLLFVQNWTGPHNEEVLAGAERAAEALERFGDQIGLARAYQMIGLTQFWLGRGAPAVDSFQRALDHARAAGAQREQSDSLTWLLVSTWCGPTSVEEGVRRCREILEQPPDRRCEAYALIELGASLAMQGAWDEGRELLRRGRTLLADLGLRIAEAGTSQELFELELLADQPAEAERELRTACKTLEEMGEKGFLSTRLGCLAEAIYAQQRYGEAERVSELAEEAATDPDDVDAQFRWRAVRAKTLARRGELDIAERLAREATELVRRTDWLNIRAGCELDLAEVLRAADRHGEALAAIDEAIRLYEQKQNVAGAAKARTRRETPHLAELPRG